MSTMTLYVILILYLFSTLALYYNNNNNSDKCLWSFHHGTAITRVKPFDIMNVELCQLAADPYTKPTGLGLQVRL